MKSGLYLRPLGLIGLSAASAFILFAFLKPGASASEGESAAQAVLATSAPPSKTFGDYWFQGKAEITSYALTQARYGELHEGTAVMMFVAEDFSPKSLTKAGDNEPNKVPVLKINFEKRFNTGIYPYHMLLTTATPIDYGTWPHTIKMSLSSAEWCGATFTQLNLSGNKYEMTEHSYFPEEGDRKNSLAAAFLEDEIWTRIRIAPDQLPTGKFSLIHSGFYARLQHKLLIASEANAELKDDPADATLRIYSFTIPSQSRTVVIRFDKAFPHGIQSFEETLTDGWGEKAKVLTTKATRVKTMMDDYWAHNAVADSTLRSSLGLETQIHIQK